jgi:hypothetical protein
MDSRFASPGTARQAEPTERTTLPNLLLPGFLLYFLAMWLGACLLIARFGGWGGLAKQYRVEKLPPGKRYHFQSASLTRAGMPCNYGSCLTLVVTEQGLGLAVFPIFRPGHPPLLIPWSDFLNPRRRTVLWYWKFFEAEVGEPAIATIALPQWLFEQANQAMAAAGEVPLQGDGDWV